MNKLNWHNEKRRVKELVPYELNPRILTDFQAKKLEQSLKKFNLVEIPAIDTDNKLIAGHQRVEILIHLGRSDEEIDVRVPNRKLTEQEFKLYNLTSNVSIGEWDFELLKDLDTDLLLKSGLGDTDLSHIWDEQLSVENDEFEIDKEIAKIKTPKTKLGDVIHLDPHILLCADSINPETVKNLAKDKMVDMIYCDPVYNINVDYDKGIGGKAKYGGTTNDNKPEAEYREFLKQSIKNGLVISKSDCHIFYWNDERHIGLIQDLYKELGIENRRVCLWIKNGFSPTPNVAFNKCYESCIYGTRGRPYLSKSITNFNEILNKEIGTGNRTIDDILDILNIWLVKRLPAQDLEHATEKPPSLHEKPLRRCSKPGDIILDLFAGAGSTMVACEQLKRKCLMVEIEPIFCDLIVRRYEKLTGRKAKYDR